MTDHRFRILDSWRGVCALLVALFHLDANGHFYEFPLIRNAWLFVDFFFVLSGFVLAHAYLDRLGHWRSLRGFAVRRIGRLWPLHIVILLLFVLFELLKLAVVRSGGVGSDSLAFAGTKSLGSLAANIVLVQSLGLLDSLTWNFPSWSISTELYVCLGVATLFLVVRNPAGSLLLAATLALLGAGTVALFSRRGIDTTCDYGFFRCLYGFAVGYLVYRLWQRHGDRNRARLLGAGEILVVALVLAFVMTAGRTIWSLAGPLLFGLAVWIFAHESGPLSRLMAWRPFLLLGTWSYSIYLGHALIFEGFRRTAETLSKVTGFPFTTIKTYSWSDQPIELVAIGGPWAMDGLALLYLAAVILFAAATYNLVEQPGRRFFNALPWARTRRFSLVRLRIVESDSGSASWRRGWSDVVGEREADALLEGRLR